MTTRLAIFAFVLFTCGFQTSKGAAVLPSPAPAIRFFNSGPGKQATDKLFELGGFVERLATNQMCFPAGTPVLTDSGPQAIETIHPGTLVWSRDPETGTTAWKPVLNTFTTHPDRFHHLRYRRASANADDPDGEISTTGQHPFWIVQLQDFLPAKDLQPGHTLLLADGGTATVTEHTADARSVTPLEHRNISVNWCNTMFPATSRSLQNTWIPVSCAACANPPEIFPHSWSSSPT